MSHSSSWVHGSSPRSTSLSVSRSNVLRNTGKFRGSRSMSWLHDHRGRQSQSSACTTVALPERGGIAAAAAAAMLQQTARGWLASYDKNLSQNFWSQQVRPGSYVEHERLPPVASDTARRENFKKDHYSSELDRIVTTRRARTESNDSVAKRELKQRNSLEELEKQVMTGCTVREIDELVQSAANQHKHFRPQNVEYDLQRKHDKHEEEQREREPSRPLGRLGRARKKTEQPRNPKWRVEERIKRERALWKDTGEAPPSTQNLPMTQFSVQTDHGKEEHSLVDVHAIQAKCRGLSANCSAKSLLEQERLREEAASTKRPPIDPNCEADLRALAELTWEERVELAQRRKLEGHISSVFNRMSQMRSKYPKEVPDSLFNHLIAMQHGDFSWKQDVYDY